MSNTQDIERRFCKATIETRSDDGEKPVIEGYAAVYNVESDNLGGFVEIIEPGFFSKVLSDDVRSLWNHNDDLVLGRTKSGTLTIEDTNTGLHTVTLPPDNTWGRDALVSMQRGDVDQMSFAFAVREGGDRWERRADGIMVRTLLPGGAAGLYDISPVTYPAYPQTSAAVRSKIQQLSEAGQVDNKPDEAQKPQARMNARKRQLELMRLKQR